MEKARVTCPFCKKSSEKFESRRDNLLLVFIFIAGLLFTPFIWIIGLAYAVMWRDKVKCPHCKTNIR